MEPDTYKGYSIWGHAIPQHDGYAASGTITKGTKLVESSGVLAACRTEDEARSIGVNWARAWVDNGCSWLVGTGMHLEVKKPRQLAT